MPAYDTPITISRVDIVDGNTVLRKVVRTWAIRTDGGSDIEYTTARGVTITGRRVTYRVRINRAIKALYEQFRVSSVITDGSVNLSVIGTDTDEGRTSDYSIECLDFGN